MEEASREGRLFLSTRQVPAQRALFLRLVSQRALSISPPDSISVHSSDFFIESGNRSGAEGLFLRAHP